MNPTCPEHLEGLCIILQDSSKFGLNLEKLNKYEFLFEIKCTCQNKDFKIYKDNHPTVIAECCNCGKKITLYDLVYYPTAIKLKNDYPIERYISPHRDELFNIAVLFEYSDEFEYEDDVEFDRNDISWCIIYGYGLSSKRIFEIINDEV